MNSNNNYNLQQSNNNGLKTIVARLPLNLALNYEIVLSQQWDASHNKCQVLLLKPIPGQVMLNCAKFNSCSEALCAKVLLLRTIRDYTTQQ